jgi:HYR domain/WD40-like Beta Propeller Repeat
MKRKQSLEALLVAMLVMMVACGGGDNRGGLRASRASPLEVAQQRCVYGAWSAPVNMGPDINGPFNESHPWITKDGLSLYITTTRFSQNVNDEDIAVAHRSSLTAPWSTPVRLGPNVNTVGFNDSVPSISEDGLDLYFHSPRPGGSGAADIYVSHRLDATDDFAWQPAVNLGSAVNNSGPDNGPVFFQANGTDYLYFLQINTPGHIGTATNPNIVLSTRGTGSGITGWGTPVVVTELNSTFTQGRPAIRRADGLEMCISRTADPAGFGGTDTYCSIRPSLSSSWPTPVNQGPTINTPFNDGGEAFDFSGTTLFFFSDRPGGFGMRDLYTATRPQFCAPSAKCQDLAVAADNSCYGSASINAGSSDNDGDTDATCTQSPAGPFGLGSTQVTLICTDKASGLTDSCTATVTVVDTTPPVIVCPADQTLECIGGGAVAIFAPTVTDNCNIASVQCSPASGSMFAEALSPGSVTCAAIDGAGNQSTCGSGILVQDTLAPVVTKNPGVDGFIASLWPPDDSLQTVSLSDCIASIADECDGTAPATIFRVTSDEPVKANGEKSADMVLVDGQTVHLRAHRDGSGDGRVYTIFANVTDAGGNTTQVSCKVQVPHDRSDAPAVDSGVASCIGQGC